MSDDDPFTQVDPTDTDDEHLESERRELEQRKRGLADWADELDEREAELDEREAELRSQRKQLAERETELDGRENRLAERETELDEREVAIENRERELASRAEELDEKERTIQEYVNDSIRETVAEALSEELPRDDTPHRFGTVGSLVLGLVGVTLIVGGVLHGFAADIALVPTVFVNDAANLGVTVLLLFCGLAANLAAVAD